MLRSAKLAVATAAALLSILLTTSAGPVARAGAPPHASSPRLARLQVPFVVNAGQCNRHVAYSAPALGGPVSVTRTGEIIYRLRADRANATFTETPLCTAAPCVRGASPAATRVSYFKGGDPSRWLRGLPTFNAVDFGQVWPGVRLELKACGGNVEKLFHVSPHARPDDIRLRIAGAARLRVTETGQLEVMTRRGTAAFTRPIAFQESGGTRHFVEVRYVLYADNEYGFRLGAYDRAAPLVIDPLLASTFLGGSSDDYATSIAVAANGDIYVAGYTNSGDFPSTPASHDPDQNGSYDAFVARFDGALSTLLACTFIGTPDIDSAGSISLATDGSVYVFGLTDSADFPTTPGAHDTTCNGGDEAFVVHLDAGLQSLLASTYLGGSNHEGGGACRHGSDGSLYVYGHTNSTDFPITSGAYSETYNGGLPVNGEGGDLFVSRFDADLTTLLASTYVGGTDCDCCRDMALDAIHGVCITGLTASSDFPTTPGAYDRTNNGGGYYGGDVFVTRLTHNLDAVSASTLLGSGADDWGIAVLYGPQDTVYVAGNVGGADFPTTPGAYDTQFGGGGYGDGYVARLSVDMTTLLASTFIGGGKADWTNALAIDATGAVYASGPTASANFPTTVGAYDTSYNGGFPYLGDTFVSRLDATLATLTASTFFGGNKDDWSTEIALAADGNVYVAGVTCSLNCPTTADAFQQTLAGGYDAQVMKLDHMLTNCFGDIDGNGTIGLTDLAQLLANYGATGGVGYPDGDLNGDGDVDLSDLAAMLGVYGNDCD